jgi:hypothetical protein
MILEFIQLTVFREQTSVDIPQSVGIVDGLYLHAISRRLLSHT